MLTPFLCHRFLKITEYLIERGADVHAVDDKENNLLHTCAIIDTPNIVPIIKLLKKEGVDVDAENDDDDTPVDIARHNEVLAALRR